MSMPNPTQELLELWRKSVEEGTQAWLRLAGQPAAAPPAAGPDFSQFWRPILTQGMEIWQQAAARGALTPELMQQWKGLMTLWIETWSKILEQAMGTEQFAQALNRYLDQWLSVQAPVRQGLEQYNDGALKTLGLPSRGQVVSLASQVIALEERVEGIEDRLEELRTLLGDLSRALANHEAAAERRAARTGEVR